MYSLCKVYSLTGVKEDMFLFCVFLIIGISLAGCKSFSVEYLVGVSFIAPPGRIVYYSPRKLMLRKTFHILNRVLVYKLAFISCTGCSNHVEFKWNGREVDFQDQNANSEKMSIYVPVLSVRVRVTTKKSCFHILSLIISRFNCVVIWALS